MSRTVTDAVTDAAGRRLAPLLETPEGQRYAARSRWLAADQAATLSQSSAATVRELVAYNSAAPADVLADLTRDPIVKVRRSALGNPHCPYPAVVAAPDGVPVTHPDCAPALVASAAEQHRTRATALKHPNLPPDLRDLAADRGQPDDLCNLLVNPATSHTQALTYLQALPVTSKQTSTRAVGVRRWAAHRNADPRWLHLLAVDEPPTYGPVTAEPGFLDVLARNPACDGGTLAALVAKDPTLLGTALRNPSCSAAHACEPDTPASTSR